MTEKGKENSITHFFVTPLLTLVQDVNVAGLLFGSESNSDLARSSNHISVKLHIAWDMLFMSHAILHCLSPSTYPAQSCELASVQRGSLEQLLDSSIHGRAFYGQQQAWEKKKNQEKKNATTPFGCYLSIVTVRAVCLCTVCARVCAYLPPV